MKLVLSNSGLILPIIEDGKTYIVFGIVRTKDNDVEKCKRHKFRYIVTNKKQFIEACAKIHHLTSLDSTLEYRTYISHNSRNVKNALKNFQKTLLEYSWNFNEQNLVATQRLDLQWFSELARPHNSNKEYMMIDLDEKTFTSQSFIEREFDVVLKIETKNGYHYLIQRNDKIGMFYKIYTQPPFNFELQTDGLLLVDVIKGDYD